MEIFNHITVSRIASLWMFLGLIIISSGKSSFYSSGPNEKLAIMGVRIDTYPKYFFLIIYTFVNTCIRASIHNIVSPWILLHVQDETKPWQKGSYELSINLVLYIWFDWFVNMNVLLSQVDIAIIDLFTEVLMCVIITKNYKRLKSLQPVIDNKEEDGNNLSA